VISSPLGFPLSPKSAYPGLEPFARADRCYTAAGARSGAGSDRRAAKRAFHLRLWDFCNDQSLFQRSHSAGQIFRSPIHTGTTYRGGMSISMLILILLLTFGVARALDRFARSNLRR
jgi:hypothetical protein